MYKFPLTDVETVLEEDEEYMPRGWVPPMWPLQEPLPRPHTDLQDARMEAEHMLRLELRGGDVCFNNRRENATPLCCWVEQIIKTATTFEVCIISNMAGMQLFHELQTHLTNRWSLVCASRDLIYLWPAPTFKLKPHRFE